MYVQELINTAHNLIAGDRGLLAMDERTPTCNKRFVRVGIPQTNVITGIPQLMELSS